MNATDCDNLTDIEADFERFLRTDGGLAALYDVRQEDQTFRRRGMLRLFAAGAASQASRKATESPAQGPSDVGGPVGTVFPCPFCGGQRCSSSVACVSAAADRAIASGDRRDVAEYLRLRRRTKGKT